MKTLTPKQILNAFDDGLEIASRWPRLLQILGFDIEQGRPGSLLINKALKRAGFRPVLKESAAVMLRPYKPYPDEWWREIARETTGDSDSSADDVVSAVRKRASLVSVPLRH